MNLPGGSVTFLFTDIEGSTRLIEDHPEAMKAALNRHHALLQEAIVARRGQVFKVVGDAFCAVFTHPADALTAALDAQHALHRERWEEIGAVRVRMGLHTGAAEIHNGEYASSLTLVRVQRVASAGHGGQTLLSSATAERVNDQLPAGTTLRDLGPHKLRGLSETENIYQLVAADLPAEFPPLRVEAAGASSAAPLQQLVWGRLVGREAESRQLLSHWERAQQAHGQLVLLSGEPGVGKTRLAQDLIAQAQQAGATVLRGGCYEYEATTPYLPIVEAFRDWVRVQSAQALRATLGATAPEIAKLAPEVETKLGALAPNAPLSPSEERLRLFRQRRSFSAVARRGTRPAPVHRRRALGGSGNAVSAALSVATSAQRPGARARRVSRDRARSRSPPGLRTGGVEPRTTGDAHRARPPFAHRHRRAARSDVRSGKRVGGSCLRVVPRNRGQSIFYRGGRQVADRAGTDLPGAGTLGAKGNARTGDPTEHQGGDRAPAQSLERWRCRHAADGGGARQDLSVPGTGCGLLRDGGSASRRA